MHARIPRTGRTSPEVSWTALTINSLNSTLCLACLDGAFHVWKANSNFVRPDLTIEGAHTKGSETGSIVFSVDGRTMLTRGGDDTVKRTS